MALHDVGLRKDPSEIRQALNLHEPRFLVIYDDGFNYLTKMCLTVMREAAFSMAAAGQKRGCRVIVSSSDSSDHYEKYLAKGADVVVRGEGEETLMEVLERMNENLPLADVRGIAFRDESGTRVTPARPVIRDLDALPFPAWDLVDIDAYREIWTRHHGYFSLNIATTRGCPFKCNWCAKPIYGNRYNSRSPEHVVQELEMLLANYHPDHFWMSDDIFGLKPGWVKAFSNQIQEKKLSFRYKIQSRVDLLVEEDTVEDLANSGVETVWVGAESGSQKILDSMDKGTTIEHIHEARELMRKNNIKVAFFLQFGYLGETREDIQATLDMVLHLMPEEIGISVSYPLPGTKFYEKVKESLNEKRNWTDSNDLDMMFHGNYPPTFYRMLHRYVHSRYRIQRGVELVRSLIKKRTFPGLANLKTVASMVYHTPFTLLHGYQLRRFHAS